MPLLPTPAPESLAAVKIKGVLRSFKVQNEDEIRDTEVETLCTAAEVLKEQPLMISASDGNCSPVH